MKKRFLFAGLLIAISILAFGSISVSAETYGDLTYSVSNGEVTITDCYTSASGELVIPDTINGYPVTSIGDDAFLWCSSITSITIPNSVTSIGDYAFYSCRSLTSITIPDSVTSIGERAFEYCRSLTSITIPDSVTSIGDYAFYDCSSLTSIIIPDSVTSIGEGAFYYCTSLKDVYYNGTEEEWNAISIGKYNDPLTNATIHYNYNPVPKCLTYEINGGEVTITDCDTSASGELVIPDTINGYPVTSIGKGAFEYCGISSITIPDSVTSIGEGAFYYCTSLENIIVDNNPSYCSIDGVLFDKSKTILLQYPAEKKETEYIIPSGVTRIGDYAFQHCISLTSIIIPDSVTSIGDDAFEYCDSLTSITIPDSVTSIGDDAFYYCPSLTSITIPDSVTSIGYRAFEYCRSLTSITIPDSVTSIGDNAFYDCSSLTSITISDSVTSIGGGAFGYCTSLTSITIPDSVTSIGEGAFGYCISLTSITIPDRVASIGESAFEDCTSLKDVYYNGTEEEWNAISIGTDNNPLTNATIHFAQEEKEEQYRINEITIKDMSGNTLQEIPTGTFLATVSFTNISASEDTVIMLAQYTESGKYKGLMYIQAEDVPIGSTIKLSIPVDNSKGDVATLKAFCWESFETLTPMGNAVSFTTK